MATLAEGARALKAFKKGLPAAILRGLRKGMPVALRFAKTKYMARGDNRHPWKTYDPPNAPPGPLKIRQGNLVRTIRIGTMRFTGKKVIASLEAGSSDVRYAAIHEYGGEIRAKNAPNLVFPMRLPGGAFVVVRKPRVLMPARPYLNPSLQDAKPEIEKHVIGEVKALARATLRGVARIR